jgi:tRNA pseudouridine55 synthase
MASIEESRRSGVLLLDKPLGISSNAALQQVRRLCGGAKAGHVGSLDPLATGMLPICIEEATKIAGELLGRRKCYHFSVSLGARTATGDAEGTVLERQAVPRTQPAQIEGVLRSFLGRQLQVPPMYSALKQAGQPLYRLARAGQEVARAPREIELSELKLVSFDGAVLALEVLCSKGTYVRTLAEDIARCLGTCGYVSRLRRAYVEPFEREPMHTLDSLAEGRAAGREPPLLPVDFGIGHLAALHLDAPRTQRLQQGQAVAADGEPSGRVRLYDAAGRFLGLGEADGRGQVRPRRLFACRQEPTPGRIPRLQWLKDQD